MSSMPGPLELFVVLLIVASATRMSRSFCSRLMGLRLFEVTPQDIPVQFSLTAVLQLFTSVAVVLSALAVLGPLAASVFAILLLMVAMSRL